jgi:hypothetical protein
MKRKQKFKEHPPLESSPRLHLYLQSQHQTCAQKLRTGIVWDGYPLLDREITSNHYPPTDKGVASFSMVILSRMWA